MDCCLDNTSIANTTNSNNTCFGLATIATAWISISIGLPLILLAIYALYFLVRKDHIAPVYVINLLISDLIQIISMAAEVAGQRDFAVTLIYHFGLMASVGFMVCVALERYLVIAFPMWYRFRRNIKLSLVVSSLVWIFPFFQLLISFCMSTHEDSVIFFAVLLLIPLPLLIFFLVGTLRSLSISIAVPSQEKQRIVGTLVLVQGIYTLLFMPSVVQLLMSVVTGRHDFQISCILLQLSPLADLALYIFMRRGVEETFKAFPCLGRQAMDHELSQANTMSDAI